MQDHYSQQAQLRRPRSALASVKHQIYHPRLPTLRRMDMDSVLHRLTGEHSRQTTLCNKDDFNNCYSVVPRSRLVLHCKNLLNPSNQPAVHNYKPLQTVTKGGNHYGEKWSNIMKELRTMEVTRHQGTNESVHGLVPRRRNPDITSSWHQALAVRSTLQQEQKHSIAKGKWSRPITPKPMPATMYSRYRSSSRPHSAYPWH